MKLIHKNVIADKKVRCASGKLNKDEAALLKRETHVSIKGDMFLGANRHNWVDFAAHIKKNNKIHGLIHIYETKNGGIHTAKG